MYILFCRQSQHQHPQTESNSGGSPALPEQANATPPAGRPEKNAEKTPTVKPAQHRRGRGKGSPGATRQELGPARRAFVVGVEAHPCAPVDVVGEGGGFLPPPVVYLPVFQLCLLPAVLPIQLHLALLIMFNPGAFVNIQSE